MSKPTDKYILSVARGFRGGVLDGTSPAMKCYMTCFPLHGFLKHLDVECKLVNGTVVLHEANEIWEHYWIELPDGRILDPTGSQFNGKGKKKMPAVYLGVRPDHYLNTPLAENVDAFMNELNAA